jgi:enoyl-[acyl-carrier protein] reductase II
MGVSMIRTALCEKVGLDAPIIQAGMSIFTSPGMAAAVSNAGALGSLGAWQRPVDQLRRDLAELRDATSRPFAVNHVVPALDAEAFAITLEFAPAVVSFALDDAGDLTKRAHDAGCLAMQQITTVKQAELAAAHGIDIVVAQGGEAGGYSGAISTLALVPQVVDAIAPVLVVAAGGIADGRGLAAALMLGAAGVNIGTRFLATPEAPVGDLWKKTILNSESDEWIQLDFINDLRRNPGTVGYGTRVRASRTEFTERWQQRRAELQADPSPALTEMADAAAAGTMESLMVVGGQSAGLIHEVAPAASIVATLVADAEALLTGARSFVT